MNYRILSQILDCKVISLKLDSRLRMLLCKFRLGNSKLPIGRGRYNNIPREKRYCELCNFNIIGDGFHFILECTVLNELRFIFSQTLS